MGDLLSFAVPGLLWAAMVAVGILAVVRVATKAGYSAGWAVLALVPVVGAVVFLVFAFSTWPIERELAAARAAGFRDPEGYYPSDAR